MLLGAVGGMCITLKLLYSNQDPAGHFVRNTQINALEGRAKPGEHEGLSLGWQWEIGQHDQIAVWGEASLVPEGGHEPGKRRGSGESLMQKLMVSKEEKVDKAKTDTQSL